MKKGYIKLILAVILGIAVIGGGIYCAYHFLSNKATTIFISTLLLRTRSMPYDLISRQLIHLNLNSVAYTYQIQPTLEELRNHTHNTSVTLPDYKKLKAQLEAD